MAVVIEEGKSLSQTKVNKWWTENKLYYSLKILTRSTLLALILIKLGSKRGVFFTTLSSSVFTSLTREGRVHVHFSVSTRE